MICSFARPKIINLFISPKEAKIVVVAMGLSMIQWQLFHSKSFHLRDFILKEKSPDNHGGGTIVEVMDKRIRMAESELKKTC